MALNSLAPKLVVMLEPISFHHDFFFFHLIGCGFLVSVFHFLQSVAGHWFYMGHCLEFQEVPKYLLAGDAAGSCLCLQLIVVFFPADLHWNWNSCTSPGTLAKETSTLKAQVFSHFKMRQSSKLSRIQIFAHFLIKTELMNLTGRAYADLFPLPFSYHSWIFIWRTNFNYFTHTKKHFEVSWKSTAIGLILQIES